MATSPSPIPIIWDSDLDGLTIDQMIPLFPTPPAFSNSPVPITAGGGGSSSSLTVSPPSTKSSPQGRKESNTPVPISQTNAALLSPTITGTSKPSPLRLSMNLAKSPFRASAPGQIVVAVSDTHDFITRGCKGDLPTSDLPKLYELLLQLHRDNLTHTLTQCYDNLAKPQTPRNKLMGVMKFSDETFIMKTSKSFLDFGYPEGKEAPLNTALSEEVLLTNIGSGKVKFKVLPIPPATTHTLTVNPKDGIIKKKGSQSISFNLKIRTTVRLNTVITIEVEGGIRYFLVIGLRSEKSVFGVAIEELDLVEDNDLEIPAVLVLLKNYLYSQDGLKQVGVFRVQGDELETQQIKNQLNTGAFSGCKDVNCVASLIKLWFRELPTPLLNSIPIETLRNLQDTQQTCIDLYDGLPEPNKSLMTWLMDMLADAIALESVNKMNLRNLAICVAPNLYNGANVSPADALVLSGKVVNFVCQVLAYRYELKTKS